MKNLITFLIILFSFKSYGQVETMKFILKSKDGSMCDKGKINLAVDVSTENANGSNEKLGVLDNNYFEQIRHSINWYNDASAGDNIGKGISFTTPEISSSKTYYASVNYTGGLPVTTDDFKKVGGEGLIFDLFTPSVLNSVEVYSNIQGKISVVIKKSDGTQFINKSFPVVIGLNKLPLNCSLPSGWGFVIEAFGLSPDIKLSTIKHDKWPISLGTFGEIVEGTENKKKYNYFFNWDVSTARVPVNASIIKSTQNITTKSECDKYFWTETSETYDKSGIYTKAVGCHTETLNLTITPSSKKTTVEDVCDKYTWGANGKTYTSSGTYVTTNNCFTQEIVLTVTPSTTNTTTIKANDTFTWSVNNKTYEVSGTYTEKKGCLTEQLILSITYSNGLFPQSVLNNRNPDKRKDFANVYFDPKYTLFDLWSDEPILPDEKGIYHVWLSSNEAKIPKQFDGSAELLSKMTNYKFKNLANCKNWCDNIPFSNSTNSIANSTKTNSNSKNQTFKEVKIGNQIWMAENLNVDHFRNGDPIPEVKTLSELNKYMGGLILRDQPFCLNYQFKPENGKKFGKLYDEFAVIDPRGLAPEGWHIPTIAEWEELKRFLGKNDNGKKLRSTYGWDNWTTGGSKTCPHCQNWNAEYRSKKGCDVCRDTRYVPAPTYTHSGNGSNTSGFSALPGGYCRSILSEHFYGMGSEIRFWSSSIKKGTNGSQDFFNVATLYCDHFSITYEHSQDALYVRCVKD